MKNTALLVIDVQQGLDEPHFGHRNNPDAESSIAQLLSHWRSLKRPVVHVKHNSTNPNSPLRPGQPGNRIKRQAEPLAGEKLFSKTVNSAFIGTGLERYLIDKGIESLVVVGLTTEHCVSTSVRMAQNLGFDVTLVADATAAHEKHGHDGVLYSAEEIHNANLASLNSEFCQVQTTEQILKHLDS